MVITFLYRIARYDILRPIYLANFVAKFVTKGHIIWVVTKRLFAACGRNLPHWICYKEAIRNCMPLHIVMSGRHNIVQSYSGHMTWQPCFCTDRACYIIIRCSRSIWFSNVVAHGHNRLGRHRLRSQIPFLDHQNMVASGHNELWWHMTI